MSEISIYSWHSLCKLFQKNHQIFHVSPDERDGWARMKIHSGPLGAFPH